MSALGQNQTFSREHYNLPLESVVVHHNKVEPPMSAFDPKRTLVSSPAIQTRPRSNYF